MRELTLSSESIASTSQISESDYLDESLNSEEREILDDCMPLSDDERLNRVFQDETKRYLRKEQPI
jgi:hypothetical protein